MNTDLSRKVFIVMGVSGCGKSSIGQLLANELSIPFIEGDDYHPDSNIEKMSQNIPLNDNDREPWLDRLHEIALAHIDSGCVISCSALKEKYRRRLDQSIVSNIHWIYLKGNYDLIYNRMKNRKGHFMDAEMLKSQFETLEAPKNALEMDIVYSPDIIVQKIKSHLKLKAEISVIGLGVMGKSLSRNLARNGFKLAIYNRHVDGKEENVASNFKQEYPELKNALPFDDLNAFVHSLERPRKIIVMVTAGTALDAVLTELSHLLEEGDIVIDGGNSHFEETNRRIDWMNKKGLVFIGAGVSGGEQGALMGPSIMPSGDKDAYLKVGKYLETIAAKDSHQNPCCTYVGRQGSGHFVKMIHNGIEYVEMQLLAECYYILKSQGLSNDKMADIFESWLEDLGSYLLKITVDILRKKEDGKYVLDTILDKAANKGTGKWATSLIADSGAAATMIPAALFARYLSFFKDKREAAAKLYPTKNASVDISIHQLKEAYQFTRIINHHQGFSIIDKVSHQNNWNVNLSEIARIWTEGCIIKSDFMKELVELLKNNNSILLDDTSQAILKKTHTSIQSVVMECIKKEIHIPCLLDAVNYFHGIKTADSSANLIQAQRDYFGSHTYKRKNDPSGNSYHTKW